MICPFSILKNKKKTESSARLNPEIREEGLLKERALKEVMEPFRITKEYDDDPILDEARNETGYDWYVLKNQAEKKDALEKLADFAEWMEQNHLRGFNCDDRYLSMLYRKTAVIVDDFTEEDTGLLPLCRNHSIFLFKQIDDKQFENCDTKEKYHLIIHKYFGMVDDAAVYGDVKLVKDGES